MVSTAAACVGTFAGEGGVWKCGDYISCGLVSQAMDAVQRSAAEEGIMQVM